MTDINVTERRLRPILDAVASRNWKQALQQCDKWQKKGEKSDRFLALKASILVNQPDKSQIEKGKKETLQLCHRDPPITDIEALYQLQDSLKHLSLHNIEGLKLWERAIAARPNDKDLLTTLLNGSVNDGNWMSAQKAAMALRKAFPKERQYDFWNMLLCYLIHRDSSLTQKDRDLFGRLAYMLMSKAVEFVPTNKGELLTTGKAVSTPEELALLVKIYGSTGHVDQAITALQSDTLGLRSRLAELDPQFVFSLLLEALGLSGNHNEVFNVCKNLVLSGSPISKEHREDDRVWKIIRDIGTNVDSLRSDCLELAKSVYQSEPRCRAAYLAYFDLAMDQHSPDDDKRQDALVTSCVAFYEVFSGKPFCYGDLSRPLLYNRLVLESFLSQTNPKTGNVVQQAFALKLRYAYLASGEGLAPETESLELATDAIRLHKQLPKEKSECPEILLLAATTLLRLSLKTRNDSYMLQASYILHNCHARFNEYYPVAVKQIQLYLTQGQINMALEKFTSLAIKNMQWETAGHLLMTRISTLAPLPSGSLFDSVSPLSALDAGLTMLDNADRSLEKAILEGLKHGSYSNIIDSVNVKSNMARSMNRQIFTIEERRIQRIAGVPQDIALDPYPAEMVDQRDFSFLPDFGSFNGRDKSENSLTCGPLPKKHWLIAMALHDHLVTHLKAELASQTLLAATAFDRLKTTLGKVKQKDPEYESQLTDDEIQSLTCHQLLSEALILAKESPTSHQSDFNALIDNLRSWLNTGLSETETETTTATTAMINGVKTPTWRFFHKAFTQLETLQTTSTFLSLQARRTKTSKSKKAITTSENQLSALQQAVIDGERVIHTQAKKLKDGINVSGVLGRLIDAAACRIEEGQSAESDGYKALAEEFEGLIDEVELEEYCGKIKNSWEDALDGVLRTKIRNVK